MLKQLLSTFPLLLIYLCCPTVFAQSPAQAPGAQSPLPAAQPPVAQSPLPAAQAPVAQSLAPTTAPSGPPNITAILEKARHFTTLIRVLKSTKLDDEITIKLNDSSQSLTMFAPTDNAFGKLKKGILNSYTDQQKFQLIKFHLIPSFLSLPAFQTVSNPMNTEAGSNDQYPINITTVGNQVNISTGIVNTTISGTIYSDNQLVVYQVDKVLLPLYFFVTPSPSPAPTPSKPEKKAPSPSGSESVPTTDNAAITASSAMRVIHHALNAMIFAGFLIAALSLCI
ncbi:hypothetical protein CsSME_00017062 [Camellia sinensis var. sinensis]